MIIVIDSRVGPKGPRGEPGLSAGSAPHVAEAGELIQGTRIVYIGPDGKIFKASNLNLDSALGVIGFVGSSYQAGDTVEAVTSGEVSESSWNFVPGLPVFLGVDGVLTQTPPQMPPALFLLRVGIATSINIVRISIGIPIFSGV